jgi:hypothetical protein
LICPKDISFKESAMSSIVSTVISNHLGQPAPSQRRASGVYQAPPKAFGARSLSALLLAAAVAAMVVLADQLVSTWADGHLMLAWVMLWVVVFAALALFAGTARSVARRMIGSLDNWSKSLADARAEARMWEVARSDPRIMAELRQAEMRAIESENATFADALAPLGMEAEQAVPKPSRWEQYMERSAQSRIRNMHMYYI